MRAEPYGRFKPLPAAAQACLAEGRVIDAVKSLRASHNLGLREARDWIDAHLASEPLLRAQLEAQRKQARRRIFFSILVVDAVIAAGVIYYFWYLPH
jgi:hypothetical protein